MNESEGGPRIDRPWVSWIVLSVLLAVAFALRWRYIQEISLFVDEFVTAWAARNVLARGIPSFPSGNIYPHGFAFTYLVAPFVLGDFDETLVRLPALLVSLAGLPAVYFVGRRFFSEQVGLLAAAAMAVDPACIIWGGRARMYGLLQLLTLFGVFYFYQGLAQDRARDRWLAMMLLILAIFTHAEAAFLLPILAAASVVLCPWRRLLRWSVILPFGLGAIGAIGFYVLSRFGQPGHLETLQESRPYLSMSIDAIRTSGSEAFAGVFASAHRLPLTLLLAVGAYFLVRPRFRRSSALTYLYVVSVSFVLLLVLLSGAGWQRERYLFLVLPLLFLIGAEVLTRLLKSVRFPVGARAWLGPVLALLVAVVVGVSGSPSAYAQEWGYDRAFRYLQERWQPEAGDRIATSMSTAAMLYLGQSDAFAIQQGYEEYVVARPSDGLASDLWTATPLLTTTVGLTELLESTPRLWFVTDGWRFQTRYEKEFILTVLDQMELEYNERGVLIFRGEGYRSVVAPAFERERYADFGGEVALRGFSLSTAHPKPSGELEVTLYWQALQEAGPGYVALLHLVGPGGVGKAGVDEAIVEGLYQPDLWPEGAVIPDPHRLTIPGDLPDGDYRLELGLYHPEKPDEPLLADGHDRLPLAALTVGGGGESALPAIPTEIYFGDELELLGYDLLEQEEGSNSAVIRLFWRGSAPMDRDYTVFVHLVGADGTIVAQDDARPGDLFLPTSTWLPGHEAGSSHRLELAGEVPPGDYTVVAGVYHQPSAERLQAAGAQGEELGDGVVLVTIIVGGDE